MTISLERENTKLSKTIIQDPLNKAKEVKEPYVDGFEYLGKGMERVRDKRLDIVNKEFLVNTSTMNTPLTY